MFGKPRKPKKEEKDMVPSASKLDFGSPEDLEIEKKWLQLSQMDPSKFEFFYRKYYYRILLFISGDIKNPDVAQELTNEVFSRALDGLDKFKWQGFSFGAWLFRIAKNLRIMEQRRLVRDREIPMGDELIDAPVHDGTEERLEQLDDARILQMCIDQLDPVRREVFQAHYWTGLKVREIAVVLDLSESNVKNHLNRGRDQLLKWLMAEGMDRGLSPEKMKYVQETTLNEEGWRIVGKEDQGGSHE